jgi:hypothetical protein
VNEHPVRRAKASATGHEVWNHGDWRSAATTIEIQKPELEALILGRMRGAAFQSVEDVLEAAGLRLPVRDVAF